MSLALILKALRVAFVVGSVLLVINQFDALFGDADIRWIPAVLTYCVPFVALLRVNASDSLGWTLIIE